MDRFMNYPIFSAAQCSSRRVGNEQTSILVLDRFAEDVLAIRQQAGSAETFLPDGKTAYPGVRVEFPPEWAALIMEMLCPLLGETYQIPPDLKPTVVMAYYSLLTTPAPDLKVQQRMPHIDTSRPHYYAMLFYLNDGEFGGTGFFRHRPTGFERITEDRRDIYKRSAWAFMATRGIPEPEYIVDSNQHYELIDQIDYKSNRLAVYPGNLLHSGLVLGAQDIGSDPLVNRLTANIFIEYT